ncbi:glycosyltransferase family 9 protein [Candidatus Pantoea multigeneris]|uniref:Glycosyltransferase family 9 protein n=1 Tax=Candidatus Pantoea multigeneris TaxID=2608357 RepID=A0ABX0RIJ3_9GAMM|nr:glycosyltransferase family 9 protein [Pantoea multigeneris]NIF24116.1 glycosyltransferase family 9 protein [Pantoea multigeneris]
MEKKKKFAKLRALNRQRNYLMKSLRLHFARLLLDHRSPRAFAITASKRVLFLRDDDKIGDMVVSTSLFREFSRAGYQVDVYAGAANACVIERNPHINNIIIASKDIQARLAQANVLAQKPYDVVIDMGDKLSPFHLRFLRRLNAMNVVGFNKKGFNIYNKSLDYLGYERHITERYQLLMESFDIKNFSTAYDLHIPESLQSEISAFLASLPGERCLVINPYAADARRDMSLAQLQQVIQLIHERWSDTDVVIIGDPKRVSHLELEGAVISPFQTLQGACGVIAQSDAVLSPDTAVVHIAAAWQKPMVCLYGNDLHGSWINSKVWGPGYPQAFQVYTQDKYHPVSTIKADDIILALGKIL